MGYCITFVRRMLVYWIGQSYSEKRAGALAFRLAREEGGVALSIRAIYIRTNIDELARR
jgi:hypothetical protein